MRVVVGVGLAFIATAVVLVLSERAPRLAGTNSVRLAEYIAVVPIGGVICQRGEYVPEGAAAVQIFTGTYGGRGAIRLAVHADGTRVRTAIAEGFRDGRLAIPIASMDEARPGATICVRNRSNSRLALAGLKSSPDVAAQLGAQPAPGRLGIEYLRAGRESWFQLVGTIARRAGDASGTFLGRATLLVALLLISISALTALVALLRGARP